MSSHTPSRTTSWASHRALQAGTDGGIRGRDLGEQCLDAEDVAMVTRVRMTLEAVAAGGPDKAPAAPSRDLWKKDPVTGLDRVPMLRPEALHAAPCSFLVVV
jgi:hypothetical protein